MDGEQPICAWCHGRIWGKEGGFVTIHTLEPSERETYRLCKWCLNKTLEVRLVPSIISSLAYNDMRASQRERA